MRTRRSPARDAKAGHRAEGVSRQQARNTEQEHPGEQPGADGNGGGGSRTWTHKGWLEGALPRVRCLTEMGLAEDLAISMDLNIMFLIIIIMINCDGN